MKIASCFHHFSKGTSFLELWQGKEIFSAISQNQQYAYYLGNSLEGFSLDHSGNYMVSTRPPSRFFATSISTCLLRVDITQIYSESRYMVITSKKHKINLTSSSAAQFLDDYSKQMLYQSYRSMSQIIISKHHPKRYVWLEFEAKLKVKSIAIKLCFCV